MAIELNEHQDTRLKQLAQMVYAHCGMNYLDNLPMLASKVEGRLQELGISLWEYTELLKDRHAAEWEKFVIAVTINETYFFREEQQLQELVELAREALAVKPHLHIWSAACSTGEEPYSMVMAFDAAGIPLHRITVHASDINSKVLENAKRGRYHRNSLCFRRTPEVLKNRYFTLEDDWYQIQARIRERVHFYQLNLLDAGSIQRLPFMDMLFCRNVLIYFDAATIARVLHSFYGQLHDGGYLFLGHAETIRGQELDFTAINRSNTFYYRKARGVL
ncbi:chemotaxis protein methyltransferase CheR [Paenibacillus phyllosphaerae]|uniref:protein-glutamate O-methyltransferase n=1 Tax=Paenibacillus phyllosphaerae TaxID=274593 RepID=A0A7W5B2I9_9BACL|nr:protein-glutamate O-methyltransferase CheR [Paenibacillus phyllosphaerae]MBB3113270.1 chemotaxis protein methyltransferase CheR [Paenibacillus phyllosphaerae]